MTPGVADKPVRAAGADSSGRQFTVTRTGTRQASLVCRSGLRFLELARPPLLRVLCWGTLFFTMCVRVILAREAGIIRSPRASEPRVRAPDKPPRGFFCAAPKWVSRRIPRAGRPPAGSIIASGAQFVGAPPRESRRLQKKWAARALPAPSCRKSRSGGLTIKSDAFIAQRASLFIWRGGRAEAARREPRMN